MSVYIYDNAITQKLSDILDDTRISIVPFEVAFRKSGAISDDVRLPFVSVNRQGYSLTTQTKSFPGYMEGKYKQRVNPEQEVYFRNSYIPISINYTLDVVTRDRQENDELCRELILYIHRKPELIAQISYKNIAQRFGFHWFLGNDIIDNSEIAEFENRGQYYRSTMTLVVDEAQLFYIKTVNPIDNKTPIFDEDGKIVDPDSGEIITEEEYTRQFTKYKITFVAQELSETKPEEVIYTIPKDDGEYL